MRQADSSTGAEVNDIIVLYTNDVHCGIDENIGYAGLAAYKAAALEKTPYVALVDCGDAIQGDVVGTVSKGEYPVDLMNDVGYDFAVLGNHEFDYGMNMFMNDEFIINSGMIDCEILISYITENLDGKLGELYSSTGDRITIK